jgi:hypothetical protein
VELLVELLLPDWEPLPLTTCIGAPFVPTSTDPVDAPVNEVATVEPAVEPTLLLTVSTDVPPGPTTTASCGSAVEAAVAAAPSLALLTRKPWPKPVT